MTFLDQSTVLPPSHHWLFPELVNHMTEVESKQVCFTKDSENSLPEKH